MRGGEGERGGVSLADPSGARLQRHQPECSEGRVYGRSAGPIGWPARPGEQQHGWEPPRVIASSRAQSALGGVPDGVPRGLAGWRRAALSALGNAIVPQVAEIVAWRVKEILDERAK